jgi:hypothetical protein
MTHLLQHSRQRLQGAPCHNTTLIELEGVIQDDGKEGSLLLISREFPQFTCFKSFESCVNIMFS